MAPLLWEYSSCGARTYHSDVKIIWKHSYKVLLKKEKSLRKAYYMRFFLPDMSYIPLVWENLLITTAALSETRSLERCREPLDSDSDDDAEVDSSITHWHRQGVAWRHHEATELCIGQLKQTHGGMEPLRSDLPPPSFAKSGEEATQDQRDCPGKLILGVALGWRRGPASCQFLTFGRWKDLSGSVRKDQQGPGTHCSGKKIRRTFRRFQMSHFL